MYRRDLPDDLTARRAEQSYGSTKLMMKAYHIVGLLR